MHANTADEIYIVYKSGVITIMTIRNWFKRFKASNFDLKVITTTNMDLYQALAGNPRYNVQEINEC